MKNKIIGISVCFLLISVAVLPVTGIVLERKTSNPLSNGNTLYVGGGGPGNYSKIQDAINDATNGTTVFVYDDSSPYYESIQINKSINLIGEDKNTTIINGDFTGDVINVSSDYVTISGFTVKYSKYGYVYSGILLFSVKDNTITNNIITNNGIGIHIQLAHSSYNNITGNNLSNNYIGILIDSSRYNKIMGNNANFNDLIGISLAYDSSNNIITGNNASNNVFGITLYQSFYNNITGNNVSSNKINGVHLYLSSNNIITGNNVNSNDVIGIFLESSSNNNHLFHNNLMNNTQNADDNYNNTWDNGEHGNYWDDYEERYPNASKIWLKGIWDTPYNISGGDNQDLCPLIKPWPKSLSKTMPGDKTISNSLFLLRFLEHFPLLNLLLQRQGIELYYRFIYLISDL